MSYIGNSPGVASQRVTTTLTATAAQTQFTTQSGYVLGYVDVYLNGAKLVNGADFEAITGTYITLFAGAAAGDIIELISYVPRGLSDGYTKAEADSKFLDVGGDTATGNLAFATATLSGNLTLNGGTANGVGYLNASKVVVAGSALTFDGTILATPTLNLTNALGVAYGGTGQTTANAALNALLPAQTGNATKYLQTDGTNTTWDAISISTADITGTLPLANGGTGATTAAGALTSLGAYAATNPSGYTTNVGTVTSVGGTGTVSGLTLTGTVSTTGNLTLGGTLDLSAYSAAGAFSTLSASGAVTLSGGTANGVPYLNGSKVLTTDSSFTYVGNGSLGLTSSGNGGLAITSVGYSQLTLTGGSTANYITSDDPLSVYVGGAETFRATTTSVYTSSGISVGIGLSNPTAQLEIGRTSTSGYSTIRLSNSGTSGRTYEIGLGGNTAAEGYANNLYFYDSTAAVNRMVLTSAGNLGVGTSTPDARLQVGFTSDVVIAMSNSSSVTSGNRGSIAMFNSANSTVGIIRFGATIDNVGTNIQFSTRPAGGALVESMYLGAGINSSNNAMLTINTIATATRQNLAAIDKTTTNWVRFTNPQYSADASMGLILRSFPNSDARQGAGIIASGGATNNSTDLSLFITNSDATSFAAYTATANGGSVDHTWNKAPNSGAMTLDANGVAYIGGTSGTATRLNLIKDTNSTVEQLLFLRNSGTGYKGTQIAFGEYTTTQGYITNHYVSTGGPIWCTDIGGTDVVRFFTGSSPGTERGRFNSTGLNVTGAITENNVAIVTQSDIGTAPNEIPLNQYLGSMAYQDGDAYFNTGMTVGFRNRIINGAMQIDQRNAGASSIAVNDNYYLDRYQVPISAGLASSFTIQQSSTAPSNFTSSLLITSSAASTIAANAYALVWQKIEGFNCFDFGWGTSSAKSVTLSFWVRSSLTGSFGGSVQNNGQTRAYPFLYTINTANTWEYKTINISGDTTGSWATNTTTGIILAFSLACGSSTLNAAGAWIGTQTLGATGQTNVLATNGATWYITGVQLERGSVATPFEYRPISTELALCQRYFETNFPVGVKPEPNYLHVPTDIGSISYAGNTTRTMPIFFKVTKRSSAPTITLYSPYGYGSTNSNSFNIYISPTWYNYTGAPSVTAAYFYLDGQSTGGSGVTGNAYLTAGNWSASSEL